MSERITRVELDAKAEAMSAMLRGDLHVAIERRNGYTALDLYDGAGCVDHLIAGTAREVNTYLRGMLRSMYLIGRDADNNGGDN